MEWWAFLAVILGLLLTFFLSGLPVAFSFTLFNFIGLYLWVGGVKSFSTVTLSAFNSIASFPLIAVPLFILMGELLLHTGMANTILDALGLWTGGIRGSLSLTAVASGTLFATLSGSSMSGVAVLGSTLVPEMRRRGYSKELSLGPILGSGGLAMIIPPSALAVLLGSVAQIPVGDLLISGIIPGLVLASLYACYIIVRASIQPHLAPAYTSTRVPMGKKVFALVKIAPTGLIIFLVVGLIFLGVATPSEAAATGVLGSFVLAALYGKLTWPAVRKSVLETVQVSSMVFLIIMGSAAFSQILAFTGVSRGLVSFVANLSLPPIAVMVAMQLVLIFMGCFLEQISMLMISIPIYMPVVKALGFDPVWFGLIVLLNLEMAGISPPFGLLLFVMKGVVPDATLADIYRAGVPFFLLGALAMALVMAFPVLATWLPGLMLR
jgi:tripartite ATP-independent transporter DctM subunit